VKELLTSGLHNFTKAIMKIKLAHFESQ